jgi:hypothetical protein
LLIEEIVFFREKKLFFQNFDSIPAQKLYAVQPNAYFSQLKEKTKSNFIFDLTANATCAQLQKISPHQSLQLQIYEFVAPAALMYAFLATLCVKRAYSDSFPTSL